MAENFVGEKTMEIRVTGPSMLVAKEKLVSALKPAGLEPDRMRCEIRPLTPEGEFSFSFSGRVKEITEK